MKDNFYIWASGGIIATIAFNPLFIEWINDLSMYFGGSSNLDSNRQPTFTLLLLTWFIFGLIWWIVAQFTISQNFTLVLLIFCWASALLFFILFPYAIAILLWAIFTFIILN